MKKFSRTIGYIVAPPLIYLIMRFIWYSSKKSFTIISPISEEQHICVCWHNELLMSPQAYRKFHPKHKSSAIISQHFDGDIIKKALSYLNIDSIRGSSSRGAKSVLLKAFREVKDGKEILITPDGPRGPKYSMSDGAIGLALRAKKPIFIMNYKADRFWQLKSWDRFIIPKPFSKIEFFMQSISIDGLTLDEARELLKSKMMKSKDDIKG